MGFVSKYLSTLPRLPWPYPYHLECNLLQEQAMDDLANVISETGLFEATQIDPIVYRVNNVCIASSTCSVVAQLHQLLSTISVPVYQQYQTYRTYTGLLFTIYILYPICLHANSSYCTHLGTCLIISLVVSHSKFPFAGMYNVCCMCTHMTIT